MALQVQLLVDLLSELVIDKLHPSSQPALKPAHLQKLEVRFTDVKTRLILSALCLLPA